MDVEIRRKIEPFGDDLVALAVPIETRSDDRLAHRNVGMHRDLAFARADNLGDKIARQ